MNDANQLPGDGTERYGEVFDRGYAHYTGPRLGRRQAIRSLIGYSIKRAMGIRKSWTAKVLPILLYVAVIIPVVAMIGVEALVPDFEFASFTTYVSWTMVIVGIFVAMSAPEMLCVDRRERTLPLYFSRAITRTDYVMSKVIAITLLTTTMTLVPLLFLWLGQQLSADAVWTAMRSSFDDLGKAVILGLLISLTLGVLALVVASMTDRKPIAVIAMLVLISVLSALSASAMTLLEDYSWSRYFILLNFPQVFVAISDHFFHDAVLGGESLVTKADLPLTVYIPYALALIVLGIFFLRWRYSPRDDS